MESFNILGSGPKISRGYIYKKMPKSYDITAPLSRFLLDLQIGNPIDTAYVESPYLIQVRDTLFVNVTNAPTMAANGWQFRAPVSSNITISSTVEDAMVWIKNNDSESVIRLPVTKGDAGLFLPPCKPAHEATSQYNTLYLGEAAQVIGNSFFFDPSCVIQGVPTAQFSDSATPYGQVLQIANDLNVLITKSVSDQTASETAIKATISANKASADASLNFEFSARQAADADLQSQIDSHGAKLDVITASPNILQSFNGVKDFIDQLKTDEQASLTSAVVTLTTSIGNETTRATSAEASLQTSISSLTSSVSSQIAAVEAEYDGKFTAVGNTLSKILAFLKSIDQDLYSQYSLAPVSSSRVIAHAFGLVQGGDVQMYGDAGPNDPNAMQIVLLQNANWSDAGQQDYTGWTIKSDCLPEYTTITGFRFDYSNYSSMFRCVYVDLSAPINGSFDGNNTFIITP